MLRVTVSFASFFCATLVCAAASADPTPKECIVANEQSIELRNSHKLKSSRELMLVCVSPSCPKEVRDECERRIGAVSAAIPTLILSAKDGDGNDLSAVRVTMNGAPFLERIDGSSMTLDPGSYDFSFEAAGKSVRKTIVLAEGESRREAIVFPKDAVASAQKRDPTRRMIGLVVAGVGLGGIALGAIFGSMAASSWSTSQSACSTTSCPDHAKAVSAHDDATTFATISTIGFIAGPVLVAAGGVLFFTAPWVTPNQSAGITLGGAF
jgi:hypothetical protein